MTARRLDTLLKQQMESRKQSAMQLKKLRSTIVGEGSQKTKEDMVCVCVLGGGGGVCSV